jgi:hypothetical protein
MKAKRRDKSLSLINLRLENVYYSITWLNHELIGLIDSFYRLVLIYVISFIIRLYLILLTSIQTFDVIELKFSSYQNV